VRLCQEGWVIVLVGQGETLLPEREGVVVVRPYHGQSRQGEERWEGLRGVSELLAECPCTTVGVEDFCSPIACRRHVDGAQEHQQVQFVLGLGLCLGLGLEQGQPSRQVSDGFHMG
jgi:hypothetical protein